MKVIKIIENIKKNMLFYATSGLSLVIFSALVFVAYGEIHDHLSDSKNIKSFTVVLDAGHGGEDGGAVGMNGTIEKNINLAVSLKLRDILEVSGYNVVMTREKDEAIYDDNAGTLREKKKSDLRNRAEIIEENTGEKSIFVSVHQNKFPDSKYFGTQIFYSKNNSGSQKLAEGIKNSIVGLIQPENTREIKPADKKIYLLDNAQIPAVVVECGFLSNADESQKLSNEEYQKQIAFCIYCGITDYFSNNA